MTLKLKHGLAKLCAGLTMMALSACVSVTATEVRVETQSQEPLTVFLVRHAEKMPGPDPVLTSDGADRAFDLAAMLIDAKIERIHTSDYKRTHLTAGPLAMQLGIEVELYDPRDLPAIAAQLKADGGRHLVVGHSNTTGELTELLGGDGGAPIVEATEYDRLYVVTIGADGGVDSTLLRFGATSFTPQ